MSIEAMKRWKKALEYHTQQTRPIAKTNEAIEELHQAIEHCSRVQTQMDDIIKTLRCPNCDSLERQNAELDLRLAEQDQPPFGYLTNKRQRVSFEPNATGLSNMPMTIDWKIPVYGSPQPQRQPLTDEQIEDITADIHGLPIHVDDYEFARAIEAAHGIK